MPHYENAPIAEAVIDLRVDLPVELSLEVFDRFANEVSDRFPSRSELYDFEMHLSPKPDGKPGVQTDSKPIGLRLVSSAGNRVLQVQRAGFTYSHMAPYSDWVKFRDEARCLWDRFIELTEPLTVNRVAVRVINRLNVPAHDAWQYITVSPGLLGHSKDELSSFFMQAQVPLDSKVEGCRGLVNIGVRRSDDELAAQLLLDFDLFVNRSFQPAGEEVWVILSKISATKNDLFEAAITEKMRAMIA